MVRGNVFGGHSLLDAGQVLMSGRIDARRKVAVYGGTPTKRVPAPPNVSWGMLIDREEEECGSKMLAPSGLSVAMVLKLVLRRWINELPGVANHLGPKVIESTAG